MSYICRFPRVIAHLALTTVVLLEFSRVPKAFLGKRWYLPYTVAVFVILALIFALDRKFEERKTSLCLKLFQSMLYGYLAGIMALEIATIIDGFYIERSWTATKYFGIKSFLIIKLAFPLVLGGWLYGLVLGALLLASKSSWFQQLVRRIYKST